MRALSLRPALAISYLFSLSAYLRSNINMGFYLTITSYFDKNN